MLNQPKSDCIYKFTIDFEPNRIPNQQNNRKYNLIWVGLTGIRNRLHRVYTVHAYRNLPWSVIDKTNSLTIALSRIWCFSFELQPRTRTEKSFPNLNQIWIVINRRKV